MTALDPMTPSSFEPKKKKKQRWSDVTAASMARPGGRIAALFWYNMKDHGFLRVLWKNMEEIAPGVWRSNQPGPRRMHEFARMGIKDVVVLRGRGNGAHMQLQIEAAKEAGITLHYVKLTARSAGLRRHYLELFELFRTLPRPFVMHCKSGADRAGIASALYLLWMGRPLSEARAMLGWRYVHLKSTKTGILDVMLDQYEEHIQKNGPIDVEDWIRDFYDFRQLTRDFAAGRRFGKFWPYT